MTVTTKSPRNKSLKQQQRQQQQQQQRRRRRQTVQHLHLRSSAASSATFSLISAAAAAAVAFVVFGLLLAGNCVSGQIDGYTANVDYPVYEAVPKGLSFKCQGRQPGYYADTETRCQVWHWCLHSGHQYSFLCPNGTVFNQAVRVCDWWSNVNCPASEQLYQNNDELYRVPARSADQGDI